MRVFHVYARHLEPHDSFQRIAPHICFTDSSFIRFVIDGNNVIIEREEVDQKVPEFEFELHGVYTIDVFTTTGTGKPHDGDGRTTVFKRALDTRYQLKSKASRFVLTQANKEFPSLPFTLRALGDDKQGALYSLARFYAQINSTDAHTPNRPQPGSGSWSA